MADQIISSFITSVVSSGVVSTGIVWLARTYIGEKLRASIRHDFDIKLEDHKTRIQHEYNQKLEAFKTEQDSIRTKQIERLRSDLHIVATEREIQFRGLQERRADVIAKVYAGLQGAHAALRTYASDIRFENPSDEELLQRLSESFDAINEHFYPKVIYLPRDLVERIKELLRKMQNLVRDVRRDRKPSVQWSDAKLKKIQDRIDEVSDELPKRMDEVEDIFRELLGDKQPRQSASSEDDGEQTV